MRVKPWIGAGAAAVFLAGAAAIAPAADKPGRYSMSPADGGFVRLDTETGEMAFCKRGTDGNWACEAMPDSQVAMRRDMDKLRQENDALRHGPPPPAPPSGPVPPDVPDIAPPQGGATNIPIPTEQDVDKLFDYVEGMAKKLKERLKRLEEIKPEKEGTPL